MKRAIIMILIIVVSCILTGEEIGFEKAVDLLSAVSTEDYPNSGQIGINNKKIELFFITTISFQSIEIQLQICLSNNYRKNSVKYVR